MFKEISIGIFLALLILLFGILTMAKTETKAIFPLKVVDNIDVQKYMGLWYEIATITMWFQKDCAGGTTANYELRDDGTVKVVNSCYTEESKLNQSTGRAWLVDTSTNAKCSHS